MAHIVGNVRVDGKVVLCRKTCFHSFPHGEASRDSWNPSVDPSELADCGDELVKVLAMGRVQRVATETVPATGSHSRFQPLGDNARNEPVPGIDQPEED
jgi:hypothetical protein